MNAVRVARFEKLAEEGRIDRDSGAWDFSTNQRRATCGRCGELVVAGLGRPYNEFMSDCYRAITRYLCDGCAQAGGKP